MAAFLFDPANSIFEITLVIVILLFVFELIAANFGFGIADIIDSILPEFDTDIDLSAGETGSMPSSVVSLLSWFRIGEVPILMLFVVLLTGFGLSGLCVQYIAVMLTGKTLPALIAVIPAFLLALPQVRFGGGLLARFMPGDETYAVSEASFHGMVATITLGTAAKNHPVQAKLQDAHGQTHYILVEPDTDEKFKQGQQVIIIGQIGTIYRVIKADNPAMQG